jgi:hypothetical protein
MEWSIPTTTYFFTTIHIVHGKKTIKIETATTEGRVGTLLVNVTPIGVGQIVPIVQESVEGRPEGNAIILI